VKLADARLQTIVCCSDLDRARTFYRDTLGLAVLAERFNGTVFGVGPGALWVCPASDYMAGPRTVFGFEVPDLAEALAELAGRGLAPERFDKFAHEPDGSVQAPDGSRVAWFKDPDGNVFSLVQLCA
jgi:catechol 2,3-dioxygenase-like lactoylglutathione lyase family enzyme